MRPWSLPSPPGVDPASDDAEAIVAGVLPGVDGPERAAVADSLASFTDIRVDRYGQLVGTINGWPPFPSPVPAFAWLIDALRAHA